MPGDPLRAQVIADLYLDDCKLVNSVRNMLGYTGKYKGVPVSVMASGMGMPSIGIYSYELYKFYDVENIIRVGSAGAMTEELNVYDIVLADSAFSESSFVKVQCGNESEITYPDEELNNVILEAGKDLGIPVIQGRTHSSDVFYTQPTQPGIEFARDEKGCCCKEMESFALFSNARVLGKRAASILTISDSMVTSVETTAEERQNSFTDMMKLALEAAVRMENISKAPQSHVTR